MRGEEMMGREWGMRWGHKRVVGVVHGIIIMSLLLLWAPVEEEMIISIEEWW